MSKDYLDKWEERAKKNTEIIEQQQNNNIISMIEVTIWMKRMREKGYTWDCMVGKYVKRN